MKKCNAKTCKKGLLKKGKCITAKTLDPDVKRHFFDWSKMILPVYSKEADHIQHGFAGL